MVPPVIVSLVLVISSLGQSVYVFSIGLKSPPSGCSEVVVILSVGQSGYSCTISLNPPPMITKGDVVRKSVVFTNFESMALSALVSISSSSSYGYRREVKKKPVTRQKTVLQESDCGLYLTYPIYATENHTRNSVA